MTSEQATPTGSGAAPDRATPAEAVAGPRAEPDPLRELTATSAVLERAKGAVMARTGCSAEAARETLVQQARAEGRTLLEECWITLGTLLPPLSSVGRTAEPTVRAPAQADPAGTGRTPDVTADVGPAPDSAPGTTPPSAPGRASTPLRASAPGTTAPSTTGQGPAPAPATPPGPVPPSTTGRASTPLRASAPGTTAPSTTGQGPAPAPATPPGPVPPSTTGRGPASRPASTSGPTPRSATGARPAPTPAAAPAPAPDAASRSVPGVAHGRDDVAEGLAGLARWLVRAGSPQELARGLLEHLAPEVGADAVMLYARTPAGGLELLGHAGVDGTLAAQWRHVPPLSGMAALDAVRAGEPRWLEDIARDRERYLLIGGPPERWRSRAWLPVPSGASADVCLGVLRRRGGPFSPESREHLLAVSRLCAGRLRAFGVRPAPVASTADLIQQMFDALPVAAVLVTPLRAPSGEVQDYRIDAATAQAGDLAGARTAELRGRRLLECFPVLADGPLWQGCRETLLTGEPYQGEPSGQQAPAADSGELSTYSVRVAALGGGLVLTWVRHGLSDRQEQRLADLQRLGDLGWADWNLVTEEAAWSDQVFRIFGRDPARGPIPLADLPGLALPDDAPALSRAVEGLVGEGRPCDVPFRTRTPVGVRHLRVVAEAVPDADGTPVEVHGFVQDLTTRRRAELALVESERAMLTQHDVLRAEQTLAARLQHALLPLPRRPLRPAGLRVEVAYLPAQSGVQVGGDWFSAVELPGGDALLVVGDVAGHGVDAVATMAQLRFTAKGMVTTGSSLTGALARLNALLLHSRDAHGTASMVMARYHPARRRLVWAQAGHPPPLLVRAGAVRYLDRPRGILLGAGTDPVYEEAECRLEPGDRLLLYTDGLVERTDENIDRGLKRLAQAVLATTGHETGAHGALERLLTAMLAGQERRDDVCVLDIRAPEEDQDPPR
ncbi:SpoIIE family protein phosphatase [Streptomyces sp. HMX87]|uniref:SpoIIE family protein phosphatase n=1 Tax=Streptomyces sp. HMX87 TaxID=3390849 RepID=UPI003A8ADF12